MNAPLDPATGRPLTIAFRSEADLDRWAQSYARGEVADAMPYGLHRLADADIAVRWRSVAPVPAARKLAMMVRPPRPVDADLSFAWDEYAAERLLAVHPGARLVLGVIWATDELQRGPAARLRAGSLLRTIRNAELAVVLSDAQIGPLTAAWSGAAPRIEHLLFGIAADFFTPAPLPERPAVLSLGNDRDRDHGTLLAALAIVHARRPDVRIRVQLKGDVALPEGVERLPAMRHDQLRDVYRESTVLAIATRPNLHVSGMTAALEAMATARPVVMTRTPGIGDYVRHGQTGLLSDPGDREALANDILRALEAENASAMGTDGREAVERVFNTAAMAQRLAAMLPG